METFPEQILQNHMIHHPLLQYQMLFPSLLMSLGAPPAGGGDDEDFLMDGEGKVNTIDFLRFSALANQLAITQINQVLMDIIKEPAEGVATDQLELQKNILENGFTQMNRNMAENKAFARNNNDIVKKLDTAMATLQDVVTKGFLNGLSEMVDIQGAVKTHANQSVSEAKEFKAMLQAISNKVEELQFADQNITFSAINCIQNEVTESPRNTSADDQKAEDASASKEILLQIQSDLQNLTKALENFIATSMDAAAEREAMRALLENCTKSTPEVPEIDISNITQTIEEGLNNNLKQIKPQVQNLTQDVGKFDATLLQAREDLRELQEALAANMSKSEADLQNLRELTEKGFADLHSKLDGLRNISVAPVVTEASSSFDCLYGFPVGEECYILITDNPVKYEEAEEECKSIDAHLADPDELLNFIMAIENLGIEINETVGAWLGGEEKELSQRTGMESRGYQDTYWTWKPSGKKIEYGWNFEYPRKGGQTCLFLISRGLQNDECDEEKYFACKFNKEGDEPFTEGFAVPGSN